MGRPLNSRFHLFKGGPIATRLDAYYVRLIGRGRLPSAGWRAWHAAIFCWGPFAAGLALSEVATLGTTASFALHLPNHVRFLVVVPLIIISEWVINRRVALAVKHVMKSGLLLRTDPDRGEQILRRAIRSRDSLWMEILFLSIVVAIAILRVTERQHVDVPMPFYEAWAICVALPLSQLILLRSLSRTVLWIRVLWAFSRLRLRIVPTHPDQRGGLGFLGRVQTAFAWVPFALSCILVADHWKGLDPGALTDWKFGDPRLVGLLSNLGVLLGASLVIFAGPLLFFSGRLFAHKTSRLYAYTEFADHCVYAFDEKWIAPKSIFNPPQESILTEDISAVCDLITVDNQARKMDVILIDRYTVLPFVFACVAPLVPLILAKIPLRTLLDVATKLFF